MLLSILEAPVVFLYMLTGNKKLGKIMKRIHKKRKDILDDFINENPDIDVSDYNDAERKRASYILIVVALIAMFIAWLAIVGYVELH